MKRVHPILLGAAIAIGLYGCSEPKEAIEEPSPAAVAEAEEAARRADETSALADRAAQLTSSISSIGGEVDTLPDDLAATVSQVRTAQDGVERLVDELGQASGDQWEGARSRLDAALNDLQAARDGAATAVADWQRRQAEALAARTSSGSPVDPETGLIIGLDGGDYEQYVPAAVEHAQARLRDLGRYAGPVDGVLDKPTMEALGEFQKQEELQVSGVPSPMTRFRLYQDGQ
jgi:peptidoglycan hydrolase-like protein with peptidoglycan-binding domain